MGRRKRLGACLAAVRGIAVFCAFSLLAAASRPHACAASALLRARGSAPSHGVVGPGLASRPARAGLAQAARLPVSLRDRLKRPDVTRYFQRPLPALKAPAKGGAYMVARATRVRAKARCSEQSPWIAKGAAAQLAGNAANVAVRSPQGGSISSPVAIRGPPLEPEVVPAPCPLRWSIAKDAVPRARDGIASARLLIPKIGADFGCTHPRLAAHWRRHPKTTRSARPPAAPLPQELIHLPQVVVCAGLGISSAMPMKSPVRPR